MSNDFECPIENFFSSPFRDSTTRGGERGSGLVLDLVSSEEEKSVLHESPCRVYR